MYMCIYMRYKSWVCETAETFPWDVWSLGLPQDKCPGCGARGTFMVLCCGLAIAVFRQELLLLHSVRQLLTSEAPMQLHVLSNGSPARKAFINI